MLSHFFRNYIGFPSNLVILLLLVSCAVESTNMDSSSGNNPQSTVNKYQQSDIESLELKLNVLEKETQSTKSDLEAIVSYLNSQGFIDFINSSDSSKNYTVQDGDIVSGLIKAQNRINYIEEKIFYGDSLYFEIINDLVILENKINRLSMEIHNKGSTDTEELVVPISSIQEFENEYKKAYYAFTKGDYSLSIKLFKDLILIDNRNNLSDNCQYWISEIHYAKGEFNIAINEFDKVLEYENTNKGAESLYKLGLCHIKLGNISEATRNFEKLETLYPEKNVLIDKSKKHLENGK